MTTKWIKIDPRDFIRAPFVECPNCREIQFGILSIRCTSYSRRCRNCLHPKPPNPGFDVQLPKLSKKLLYLDQFAISELAKIRSRPPRQSEKGSIWDAIAARLDRLLRLQLIACPDSSIHEEESQASGFFQPLQETFKRLSAGVSFRHALHVKMQQLRDHAILFAAGRGTERPAIRRDDVLAGDLDCWQERFLVVSSSQWDPSWIAELQRIRGRVIPETEKLFVRWKSERDRSFDDFYVEERLGIGRAIVRGFAAYASQMYRVQMGIEQLRQLTYGRVSQSTCFGQYRGSSTEVVCGKAKPWLRQ